MLYINVNIYSIIYITFLRALYTYKGPHKRSALKGLPVYDEYESVKINRSKYIYIDFIDC